MRLLLYMVVWLLFCMAGYTTTLAGEWNDKPIMCGTPEETNEAIQAKEEELIFKATQTTKIRSETGLAKNPVALRNYLEALGYRISRHLGGEFSILDPISGTPRTEEWATQIRFTDGVMTYPLYKFNFDTSASSGLNFLKNGGFVNGQDWIEAWNIASSGGGMRTVQGQIGQYYKDIWKIFKRIDF